MTEKNNKYYLAETYDDNLHTASIVRKDNEKILQQLGFTALQFRHIRNGSVIIKLKRLTEIMKLALSVKKGDIVVFHFPLLANAYKVLLDTLNKKGAKTIAIIIDIDGLRYNDKQLLQKEIEILGRFTHIIAHNASMKQFLSQHITGDNISCIELFDYPCMEDIPVRELSNNTCYAGNFEKAGFVNELNKTEGIHFNLYGPSFTSADSNHISYKGSFAANELPQILEGSFGLVWDGESIDTCDEYLRFNNPHKLSLYIAAGLPLIVWQKSAFAAFIQQNYVGIVIDSLRDIRDKISQLTDEEYSLMKMNIEKFRTRVNKGSYLTDALTSALSAVSTSS